ncbi:MAG: aminotransferase class IV [Fusobacterium sp.]|nr:aminotransferase class IV [Fusobacterium sp.]
MEINLDKGYSFGLGVFETIYIHKGKAIFLDEHLERLENSIKKLEISKNFNKENLKKEIAEELKNNFSKEVESQVLKIIISDKNKIFLKREYSYKKEDYEKGFVLNIAQTMRNEKSIFTFHKTLNYADNIFEKRKSKSLAFDEPIFLNSQKQITEGATSNIFFVKGNKIYTPKISSGLLNGILRQYLIKNFEIIEIEIYLEDLENFDEVFITNSLLGIMAVNKIEINKNKIYEFKNREISQKIFKEYKKILEKSLRL